MSNEDTKILFHRAKILFHRDRYGQHIFYSGMNKKAYAEWRYDDLLLNGELPFSLDNTVVVPPVTRVSSIRTENQTTGFVNTETGEHVSVTKHQGMRHNLEQEVNKAVNNGDSEQEVRARVELRKLDEKWTAEEEEVKIHTDFPFEVVDIDYPADDRLEPLRHFDTQKVNQFEVDGKKVAQNFMVHMCEVYGLTRKGDGQGTRGTYEVRDGSSYYSPRMSIEGRTYDEHVGKLRLATFTGSMEECRNYVNSIEKAIRMDIDLWRVHFKQPDHLTVGFVEQKLGSILRAVQSIDTKIKTKNSYERAIALIHQTINETRCFAIEELADEENDDEEVDIFSE